MAPATLLADPAPQPRAVLRRVFGFDSFRGLQEDAITHLLAGGDALVLMPTGGGKSLCYQIPALCRPGTAIIVSPLIALMDDQVAALQQLGVAAAALHSEQTPDAARAASRALDAGQLDLLYLSPERLLSPGMAARLGRQKLALIAIDEAHCVSQWGHEFRPEYRLLAELWPHFPAVPRIALTATADARTRSDILAALQLPQARIFAASFHRPNLHLAAAAKAGETAQLMGFLKRHAGETGIVYCGTRARVERMSASLEAKGLPAIAYHAGLPPPQKRAALTRFRSGDALIMVATIAFGMGIDRPDVRFVAHLDMPDSPEAYYQQIGRAGRDGLPAETLLLYGGEDFARARHFLSQSNAPEAQRQSMRARLEAMVALAEVPTCRTRTLLACFGESLEADCGHCDNCLSAPKTFDGTVAAQKVLSAIWRTGQRFGSTHVVDVLLGRTTEAVTRWAHDRLPTFGIGADQPTSFWRGVIRQLIGMGALDVAIEDRFSTLMLVADRARPILRGEVAVMLRADTAPPAQQRQASPAGTLTDPDAIRRFNALRAWRLAEARTQNVPPYVIFHDSTLQEIANTAPAEADQLGGIRGVGASKLQRYGTSVLQVIRESA